MCEPALFMSASAAIADPLLRRASGWRVRPSAPHRTARLRLGASGLRAGLATRLSNFATDRHEYCRLRVDPFFLRDAVSMAIPWNTRGERLSIAGDHIVGGHREGSFGRTVFELVEISLGRGDVGSCAVHGIGDRAKFLHQANEPPEVFLCQGPAFHAVDDHLPVLFRTMMQQM